MIFLGGNKQYDKSYGGKRRKFIFKIPIIQYTKQLEFIAEYPSTIDAIEALGLPKSGNAAICKCLKCLKGKIKSYKGFVWKYA